MKKIEIEQKVMRIIADLISVDVEDVKIDSSFVGDLHFDSLDAVELIMSIEDEFNISITDEEAEKMMTVNAVVAHVEKTITE